MMAKEKDAESTSNWYFSLTPFESIMLGYAVLKLMVLRYMDFTPILTALNNGTSTANTGNIMAGKRRKRSSDPKVIKEKERLAETMFTVLRRLDMQDCLLRTLCELQVHSLHGHPLTRETKLTLSALKKSGAKRRERRSPNPDVLEERPVLSVFEEAVEVGWDAKGPGGIECQERYFICPLTQTDILKHFDTIKVLNVL